MAFKMTTEVLEETVANSDDKDFSEETEDLDTFDSTADVMVVHDVQCNIDTVYRDTASDNDGGIQDAIPTGTR